VGEDKSFVYYYYPLGSHNKQNYPLGNHNKQNYPVGEVSGSPSNGLEKKNGEKNFLLTFLFQVKPFCCLLNTYNCNCHSKYVISIQKQ